MRVPRVCMARLRGVACNGNEESSTIPGSWKIGYDIGRAIGVDGIDRRGTLLGAAEATLQFAAFRSRGDLGGEKLAAFSAGDDA